MVNKNNWEEFFDGHAPQYLQNVFTKNTFAEVNFIVDELKLPRGSEILDIGCGTGRHSVELAERGYKMTGVDLSSGMLAEAEKAARAAAVNIELIHCDAAKFRAEKTYDAAICLCEGAFCLLGQDDDPIERDVAILSNIYDALKPDSKFILTALNGLKKIKQFSQKDVDKGLFDHLNIIELYEIELDLPGGHKSLVTREKGYIASELKLLFHFAGFGIEQIYGGTAGNWGRRPLDINEMEIMIIAKK